VAADGHIHDTPRVVYINPDTEYYDRMRSVDVFKVGFTVCMRHGYDSRIDEAPRLCDGDILFPATAYGVKSETPFVSADLLERPVRLAGDLIIVGDGNSLTEEDLARTEAYLYSFALSGAVQWKPTMTQKYMDVELKD
jgi:hypothetical protein